MLNSNLGMTNRAATDKMSLSVTPTLFGHCNTLIFSDRNILATPTMWHISQAKIEI